MTRITDAVQTANRIMRKYDERDPERIALYAGIMILPQPHGHCIRTSTLGALKIAELNRRGYQLREQEYRNKFLKS